MAWSIPANVVSGAQVAAATTNAVLADLTVLGGAWTAYTPTVTGVTLGTGGATAARARAVGKTVDVAIVTTLGTGGTLTASPTFTIPAGLTALTVNTSSGDCVVWDSSPGVWYDVKAILTSTTVIGVRAAPGAAGNNLAALGAALPMTWATGDSLTINMTFEVA